MEILIFANKYIYCPLFVFKHLTIFLFIVFCLNFIYYLCLIYFINQLAKNFIIERLKTKFKNRESFSRKELLNFYRQFEPDLKETTFRWRIYHLKEMKVIRSLAKGTFSLTYRPAFIPEITESEKRLYNKVEKQFPQLKQCIWSTRVMNEFMLHIPGKFITLIEVEKDALEPVFHYLQSINNRNVYLQPDEKEIERYLYETEGAVVIKPLVSKAPTQKVKNITVPTIEKILVDIFSESKLFSAFQGSELVHITNNAYNRYAVDATKISNYAKRRGKEKELIKFLANKTEFPKRILND